MTKDRPKILIIDDIPANVIMLGEALADEFEVEFALSGVTGLAMAAQAPQPDLILLDVVMPYRDGYQTYIQLRNDEYLRHIPVIFVTALSDPIDEGRGLALGAADYISKPINIKIAKLRIRNLLERERQRREIKSYRRRLAAIVNSNQALATARYQGACAENIACHDPLTEVPNRHLLIDHLNRAIAHAKRFHRMLAICHLDLDDFTALNDRLGPDAGDQLLVATTYQLSTTLRQCDSLARLDNDEFVILLSNIENEAECYAIMERVSTAIKTPVTINEQSITISAKWGVTFYPHDNADVDDLLHHAEQAMHQANRATTQSVTVQPPSL